MNASMCANIFSCHHSFSALPSLDLTTSSLFHMPVHSFFHPFHSSLSFPFIQDEKQLPSELIECVFGSCVQFVYVSVCEFVKEKRKGEKERKTESSEWKDLLC